MAKMNYYTYEVWSTNITPFFNNLFEWYRWINLLRNHVPSKGTMHIFWKIKHTSTIKVYLKTIQNIAICGVED